MTNRTREQSLRSIYATQRKARNRNPGWKPDYVNKLPDDALEWLADFEAGADGHKAPAERIGVTPEIKKKLGQDRYRRDQEANNSNKMVHKSSEEIVKLMDERATEGKEICPFASGTAKEAK